MNRRDAALQLAYAPMHPDRRRQLCVDLGGPEGALRSIWSGKVTLPEDALAATRIPAAERREALAVRGIGLRFLGDPDYPPGLSDLANPPSVLFTRGSMPSVPGIAIVGTRRATGYGLRLAESFGRAMAGDGRTVVSGLAKGIDGAAHRGMVGAGGRGIAVLGSGVDRWYPAVNRTLGEQLLKNGSVISEYPPGTRPSPWRFPPRNRIIVGLSAVVLIVEAGMPGGAMITGRMAADEHRELFAVPGDIGRPASVGCNLLIRDGGWPVLGVDDLREAVDRILGPPVTKTQAAEHPRSGIGVPSVSPLIAACDPAGTPIDELAKRCHRSVSEILVAVTELELAGVVRVEAGRVVPQ